MHSKILAILQEQGPSLPAQLSSKLNINSFLAKAFLEELVEQGKVKAGQRVGTTNIFYLPGQESQAKQQAEEANSPARTVAAHVGKDLDMSPEAVAKRERFKKHFAKTLSSPDAPREKAIPRRTKIASSHSQISSFSKPAQRPKVGKTAPSHATNKPPASTWASTKDISAKLKTVQAAPKRLAQPSINQSSSKREPQASVLKTRITKLFTPTKVKPKKKKVASTTTGEYIKRVKTMFQTNNAQLIETIEEKKKQGAFVAEFPSSIGAVRYLVTVLDKKTINKSDIALAYTEASNRKLPALLLTNGKLAGTAKDYAEDLGGMFRWKIVK